mmetsp:Transcript_37776/g.108370  ORF Transcript_37776/g.108370 Transcript_37776/m.108370 type:complete len:154 (+) Transcript_37776:16-477(+)
MAADSHLRLCPPDAGCLADELVLSNVSGIVADSWSSCCSDDGVPRHTCNGKMADGSHLRQSPPLIVSPEADSSRGDIGSCCRLGFLNISDSMALAAVGRAHRELVQCTAPRLCGFDADTWSSCCSDDGVHRHTCHQNMADDSHLRPGASRVAA